MRLHTIAFEESTFIARPPAAVFATLADPGSMIGLQPLLVGHQVVATRPAAGGKATSYDVVYTERFAILGPLHYDNRLRVQVTPFPDELRVEFDVRSFPRIRLASAYHLSPATSGTAVRETVTIESPALLVPIVLPTARKAHVKLLANLKQRLEAPASR